MCQTYEFAGFELPIKLQLLMHSLQILQKLLFMFFIILLSDFEEKWMFVWVWGWGLHYESSTCSLQKIHRNVKERKSSYL